MSKEFYEDWLSDNIADLRQQFIEEHGEEFEKFCKKEFADYLDERKLQRRSK